MITSFSKYQATGNDFILIDNRQLFFPKKDSKKIAELCHRRFGIGADGLILLENHDSLDFKMVYFNSDGRESSMCGNGGRSVVHFAQYLKLIKDKAVFEAVDGIHQAFIENNLVKLEMANVDKIEDKNNAVFLNTGSPHHVEFIDNLKDFDVVEKGRKLRYETYGNAGSNINFAEQIDEDSFFVRTYERGVEDETYSCGTGVTAVALAAFYKGKTRSKNLTIKTPGGVLKIYFEQAGSGFQNIFLEGLAVRVFNGIFG